MIFGDATQIKIHTGVPDAASVLILPALPALTTRAAPLLSAGEIIGLVMLGAELIVFGTVFKKRD